MRSYSNGLDTEEEKLFVGLGHEDVLFVKCGDGLMWIGIVLVIGNLFGLLLFLLRLHFT